MGESVELANYTMLHLFRSLIRKGHAKDVGSVDAVFLNQIGIPADQQFRFSAAGSGDYAHIAFSFRNSFQLLLVQSFQVTHGAPPALAKLIPVYDTFYTARCPI